MQTSPTTIHAAMLLRPRVFRDERGFFLETWNRETFRRIGLDADFVQDNHSRSAQHVLRGLHYQAGAAAQGKLVWVTSGSVFDVIVDLRTDSPTFGRWEGHFLDAETHGRLWVPPGCAHGFLVVSERCDFHYKVTAPYDPRAERTLRWDDPDLAIAWPLPHGSRALVSDKDASGSSFADCEKFAENPHAAVCPDLRAAVLGAVREVAPGYDGPLDAATLLGAGGVGLDSIGFLELVLAVEKRSGVRLRDANLTAATLASPASLVRHLEEYSAAAHD